jgi:hypothetical protein
LKGAATAVRINEDFGDCGGLEAAGLVDDATTPAVRLGLVDHLSDEISIAEDRDVGVMGDHEQLPPRLGLEDFGDDEMDDIAVTQLVFGLVDDQRAAAVAGPRTSTMRGSSVRSCKCRGLS